MAIESVLLNDTAKNFPNPIFAFAITAGSAKHLTCAYVRHHAKTHEWRINELRVNRLLQDLTRGMIVGRLRARVRRRMSGRARMRRTRGMSARRKLLLCLSRGRHTDHRKQRSNRGDDSPGHHVASSTACLVNQCLAPAEVALIP